MDAPVAPAAPAPSTGTADALDALGGAIVSARRVAFILSAVVVLSLVALIVMDRVEARKRAPLDVKE